MSDSSGAWMADVKDATKDHVCTFALAGAFVCWVLCLLDLLVDWLVVWLVG